jgi:hypothetical protein
MYGFGECNDLKRRITFLLSWGFHRHRRIVFLLTQQNADINLHINVHIVPKLIAALLSVYSQNTKHHSIWNNVSRACLSNNYHNLLWIKIRTVLVDTEVSIRLRRKLITHPNRNQFNTMDTHSQTVFTVNFNIISGNGPSKFREGGGGMVSSYFHPLPPFFVSFIPSYFYLI